MISELFAEHESGANNVQTNGSLAVCSVDSCLFRVFHLPMKL